MMEYIDEDKNEDDDEEDKGEDVGDEYESEGEYDEAFVVGGCSEVDGFCVDCGGRSTKRSVDMVDNIGTEEGTIDSFVES